MQNNHGQALVIFIIILPLILLLFGSIIELSIISYNKMHLNSITKTIIASTIDTKEKNDIINLYHKNNIEADFNIDISDGLEISFTKTIDSYLGKLIGKENYEIKIDIKGKQEDNKVRYEKGKH